jgi:hypothetical protein
MNLLDRKVTLELSARQLETLARMAGISLGYAIPNRHQDREIAASLYDIASRKLTELLYRNDK